MKDALNMKFTAKRNFNRVTVKGYITSPDDVCLIDKQLLDDAEDNEVTFLLWNQLAKCSEHIDSWEALIAEDSSMNMDVNKTT